MVKPEVRLSWGGHMLALCPEEGVGICQIRTLLAQDRWACLGQVGSATLPGAPRPTHAAAEGFGRALLSQAQPTWPLGCRWPQPILLPLCYKLNQSFMKGTKANNLRSNLLLVWH